MEALARDVQVALRGLRRRPGFTLVVALTLGLGIGATTAVFSVVDTVLVRPLPYSAPERLAVVVADLRALGRLRAHPSGPELAALWEGARAFEEMGGLWAVPASCVAAMVPSMGSRSAG